MICNLYKIFLFVKEYSKRPEKYFLHRALDVYFFDFKKYNLYVGPTQIGLINLALNCEEYLTK
jgi:hypothetical protein